MLSAAPTAPGDGSYAYTYNVTLTGGQIDPVGSTDRNGNIVAAQFGTFYDFGSVLTNTGGTSYTATGLLSQYFTFTFANTNLAAYLGSPSDSASLLNVRFTYDNTTQGVADPTNTNQTLGSYIIVDSGLTGNLGTFTVDSPYGPALNNQRSYNGQTYKGTNNTIQGNQGLASGPSIPTGARAPRLGHAGRWCCGCKCRGVAPSASPRLNDPCGLPGGTSGVVISPQQTCICGRHFQRLQRRCKRSNSTAT